MGQQGFVSRVSVCRCGEIGRHEGLKIPFWRQSTGSTPVGGMKRLPDEAGGAPAVEDPASMKPVE